MRLSLVVLSVLLSLLVHAVPREYDIDAIPLPTEMTVAWQGPVPPVTNVGKKEETPMQVTLADSINPRTRKNSGEIDMVVGLYDFNISGIGSKYPDIQFSYNPTIYQKSVAVDLILAADYLPKTSKQAQTFALSPGLVVSGDALWKGSYTGVLQATVPMSSDEESVVAAGKIRWPVGTNKYGRIKAGINAQYFYQDGGKLSGGPALSLGVGKGLSLAVSGSIAEGGGQKIKAALIWARK